VLDALASLDLADNTIVVVTSDHGEILYEHEYYFGHDIALYEECIMIPLIIRAPTVAAEGRRISHLVQSIDIMPTLLEILDVAAAGDMEGKSLLPVIAEAAGRTADHMFSETFPFPEKCLPRHAVRTEEHKLIWKETRDGPILKEFYDLKTDPGETRNLFDRHPAAGRLDSVLTAWIAPKGLHPAPIPTARESGRWRILRSLGYVD
jgi:arylsulfatase A-like enzyme